MSRVLSAAVRAAVLAAHGRRCQYCGAVAQDVDHILPASLGGTDDPENLIASCKPCNRFKRSKMLPDEQMQAMRSRAASVAGLIPREVSGRRRRDQITLDLSEDEERVLKALAKRLGVSMQGVLRMGLLKLNERGGE